MRYEPVTFPSAGTHLSGRLYMPPNHSAPFPTIVQGPGWLGIAATKSYTPYHEAFMSAGYAVLIFDYRGFGASRPLAQKIDPNEQVVDLGNAIRFVRTHPELDETRLAVFGSGGTGGGNGIVAAAQNEDVKAVIAQVPIADGKDWLRRMRSDEEWAIFLARLAKDRSARASNASSEMVLARGELTVAPEVPRAGWKDDVVEGVPRLVELSSAEDLFAYRPIDVVHQIAPRGLLIIGVDNDEVTPTAHSKWLYEAAGRPKSLILLQGTTHYSAYADFRSQVIPIMVGWFDKHVRCQPTNVFMKDEVIKLGKP